MSPRRSTALLWASLLFVAACGSSSKPNSTAPATTAPQETASNPAPQTSSAVSTTVTPSPATATSGPAATPAETEDTSAITAAFTTFFDGINPDIDGKVAVLENGQQLRQMLVDAAANPQFQQLTTVVNSVTAQTPEQCAAAGEVSPCATVAHDMFVGGLPAMVGLTSHAVEVGGVWKVSAKSWCAIVQIGGATCPTTG